MGKKYNMDDMLNDLTYSTIYNRLKLLALNRFEWEGLPDGIETRHIEKALYNDGRVLFFKDPRKGLLCLPALPSGGVNVNNEHRKYRANGINYQREYSIDPDDNEAVLIRNNDLEVPTHNYMRLYAYKLTNIERSLDSNVNIQKFPFIIKCDDKSKLTMLNIFDQVQSNAPAIYADKNLDMKNFEILFTNAPFVCDKLADYKHDVWNDALTFLGINNANTDKRERLNSDEVNSNNEFIEHNILYMLEARKKAAEEINKMFPELNVSVKLREVESDGQVHTGSEGVN